MLSERLKKLKTNSRDFSSYTALMIKKERASITINEVQLLAKKANWTATIFANSGIHELRYDKVIKVHSIRILYRIMQ